MKKKIDSPFRKLRMLLVLPLVAMVFYAFAKPEYVTPTNAFPTDNVNVSADGNDVKGKVVKTDGKPLHGTSVIIAGTTIGTIADADGNFKLNSVPKDAKIAFSFVGFKTAMQKPDFNQPMTITMITDTVKFEEGVVAVGYGTPPPPSEMKLIVNPPYHFDLDFNISQLEKDFIKSSSENPPLIVLDGVTISKSKMESVSPDEIGYINALKDQSATGKYGDKGKYGVIEIVSKVKMASEEKDKKVDSIVFDDPKNEPLIYSDGKIIDYKTMRGIKPDLIESMNVLKGEAAIVKYGEKGKNGVLELTLKRGVNLTTEDVTVVGYGKTSDMKSPSPPLGFSLRTNDSKNPPLFILDGVISEKTKMDEIINPDDIESVNVLKGENATKYYGDKGKNGVILINSKKQGVQVKLADGSKTEPSLYFVDGKEKTSLEVESIDPNRIESMNVLKGEYAVKKYGEKGREGVVEIKLKSANGANAGASKGLNDVKIVGVGDNSPKQKNEKEVFVVVEEMPEFPGGEQACKDFIARNLKYPSEAIKNGKTGKVVVTFIVNKNGKVENAKVIRGIDPALDAEVVRVVNSLPDWKPGKQRGTAVDIVYTMPFEFQLQ